MASDAVVQLEVEVPRVTAQVTVVLLHAAEAEVLVLRCVEEVRQVQHAVLVRRVEQVVLRRAVLVQHVERRVVEVQRHDAVVVAGRRLV
jgi:hypothetical protein